MKGSYYQIQVSLLRIKPKIWRRLIVKSNTDLHRLHLLIQDAMGWSNYHLYMFKDGRTEYSPEDDFMEGTYDSTKVKLKSVLKAPKQKLRYIYDFGDDWEHEIVLEKIFDIDQGPVPRCITGRQNCPPEDCGGPWGYMDLVEAMADRKNPRYEELIEWLGEEFDPGYFNADDVNYLWGNRKGGGE